VNLAEFVDRYESVSGHGVDERTSRHRFKRHAAGTTEICVLAVSRYGVRACEIASILCKGGNSVTRWLILGFLSEHEDPEFAGRLDILDLAISRR
jgi:hypothetical protein